MSVRLTQPTPTLLFFAGVAASIAVFAVMPHQVDGEPRKYPTGTTAAMLVYAVTVTTSVGWAARRTRRRSAALIGTAFALCGAVLGFALLVELAWVLVGPGVEPLPPSTCVGGMDCISYRSVPPGPVLGEFNDPFGFFLAMVFAVPFAYLVLTVIQTGPRQRASN